MKFVIYEGEFKNDKFEGKWIYKYADGHVYEGKFENNNKNG